MESRFIYRSETGKLFLQVHLLGEKEEFLYFTKGYVLWLENQLTISGISKCECGSSEDLATICLSCRASEVYHGG